MLNDITHAKIQDCSKNTEPVIITTPATATTSTTTTYLTPNATTEQISNEFLDALVEKVILKCKSSVDCNFVVDKISVVKSLHKHSECSTQTESTQTFDKCSLTTTTTTTVPASVTSDQKASFSIDALEEATTATATTTVTTTAPTATEETINLKTDSILTTTTTRARGRDQETSTDFEDDWKVKVVDVVVVDVVDASTTCDLLFSTGQPAPPRILITTGLLDCFVFTKKT